MGIPAWAPYSKTLKSLLLAEVGKSDSGTESCMELEAPSGDGLSARIPLAHLREAWKKPLDW